MYVDFVKPFAIVRLLVGLECQYIKKIPKYKKRTQSYSSYLSPGNLLLIAMGINRYVYNNYVLIKDPSPPVNYYSVQYGIGFTYPENWKVIESTENTEPLKDCQIYIDGGNPWACFSFF